MSLFNTEEIMWKCIGDERLRKDLDDNISFAEKYLNEIEKRFDRQEEKQIAYKALGVIVYSCLEGFLQTIERLILNKCKERNCSCIGQCKYVKFRTYNGIDHANVASIIRHLKDIRLIAFTPIQQMNVKIANEIRNFIHLSKIMPGGNGIAITYDYVVSLLDAYSSLYNQIRWSIVPFLEDAICLKELDEDGFDSTKELNDKDFIMIIGRVVFKDLIDVFNGKPVTQRQIIETQKLYSYDEEYIDAINKMLGELFAREIYYSRERDETKNRIAKIYDWLEGIGVDCDCVGGLKFCVDEEYNKNYCKYK